MFVKTAKDYEKGNQRREIFEDKKESLDSIDRNELINILKAKLGAEKNEDSQINTK
jgi:hypothetical protein